MSKSNKSFSKNRNSKKNSKPEFSSASASLPPPPTRSRSFDELRAQVQDLKAKNEQLRSQMDSKPQPTADEIQFRNPTRANPKPSNPEIKLEQYATDWIEEEHSNVLVDLKDDFEDYSISELSKVVKNDNMALLGMTDEKQQQVVSGYKSFSVLNVCYRLLLTLPSRSRMQAQELINTIKADDTPENVPLIAELTSHLGKTKTDNYGNIRINYQLHHAKKRIVKAISYVWNQPDYRHEISKVPKASLKELFKDDSWTRGVFLDSDSLTYLRHSALKYLHEAAETDYSFIIDEETYKCGIPSLREEHYTDRGQYKPTVSFILRYMHNIGWIKDDHESDRHKIMAALITFIIDLDFVEQRTTPLADYDNRWTGTDYANTTFENLMEYLGITILDDFFTMDNLKKNYSVITANYRDIIEPKIKCVFKTVPLKRDEFGTEALMMTNPSWTKDEPPSVTSGFKISNSNNIVASGIFGFTDRVKFAISDRMYLKSPVRNVVSEMISKFCRKK